MSASGVLLAIDASTYAGSVCVVRDGAPLSEETTPMRGADEERLMPAVAAALERAGVTLADVGRVVCGEGPGSVTSLRIAASIAKGIAVARELPLATVSSLALMVAASPATGAPGEYIAALDALRGEMYVARCLVDDAGEVTPLGDVSFATVEQISAWEAQGARVVGPHRAIEATPHARGVVRLSAVLAARAPVDLAGWAPSYGRLAEAQVQWEAKHGRSLPVG